MSARIRDTGSLRRRLIMQLMASVAVLAVLLNFTVRYIAEQAAESTQDNILGASVISIIDEVQVENGDIVVDIPYSSLSMLGTISDDQVFYRIDLDGALLTGYEDLARPPSPRGDSAPQYWTDDFRGQEIRLASSQRQFFYGGQNHSLAVTVAQTRNGQAAIVAQIANTAGALGLGFFLLAGALSWAAASTALRPLRRLEQSVRRRGPHDLRPIQAPAPREVVPLLLALNNFMERLRRAHARTEDFIAEAAHRIRTPLATVRTNAEIALHKAEDRAQRTALRAMIRAVDDSSRSANQLLEHAMVSFRAERIALAPVRLADLVSQVVNDLSPTCALRDIAIRWHPDIQPTIQGDKILLIGALRNLLDNAIKYSPDESEITITLRRADGQSCVTICDQGRGLGGEGGALLKKRFQRGANAADVVGSGLGLTIADEVAQIHGGSLTLNDNQEGAGTCVCLCLPDGP